MTKVQICLYEQELVIRAPISFAALKRTIADVFLLHPKDVEELLIYAETADARSSSSFCCITSAVDYQRVLNEHHRAEGSRSALKIVLEISETSKIFVTEIEKSKLHSESKVSNDFTNSNCCQQDAIVREIEELEKSLVAISEKRKLDKQELVLTEMNKRSGTVNKKKEKCIDTTSFDSSSRFEELKAKRGQLEKAVYGHKNRTSCGFRAFKLIRKTCLGVITTDLSMLQDEIGDLVATEALNSMGSMTRINSI